MSVRPVPAQRLWFLVLGFGAWCSALTTVYVLHSVGCTFAWSTDTLRLSLALAILAHLVLIGWLWRNYAKTRELGGRPDRLVPSLGDRVDLGCGLRHYCFHPRPITAANDLHLTKTDPIDQQIKSQRILEFDPLWAGRARRALCDRQEPDLTLEEIQPSAR